MPRRNDPDNGAVPMPGEWAERAACKGKPTSWWYPGSFGCGYGITKWAVPDADKARMICFDLCQVRNECLVHALRYGEVGIWAGTDERQRKKMRAKVWAA